MKIMKPSDPYDSTDATRIAPPYAPNTIYTSSKAVSNEEETMNDQETPFEGHAIVELMGHNIIAGYVSQQVIAGAAMLRVDVPETEERPAFTKFFAGAAIYGITPTGEKEAKIAATRLRRRPVDLWVLPETPQLTDLGEKAAVSSYDDDFEEPGF